MTRAKRHNQQERIRRLKARGDGVCAISKKLGVSHSQVQRALMTEEQRTSYCAQAAMREERRAANTPWGHDRLLKRLYQVFGEPRCDTAPELIDTKFA